MQMKFQATFHGWEYFNNENLMHFKNIENMDGQFIQNDMETKFQPVIQYIQKGQKAVFFGNVKNNKIVNPRDFFR